MKEILLKKFIAGTSTHEEEQKLLALLQEIEFPTLEEETLIDLLSMNAAPLEDETRWMDEDESELFDQLMKEQEITTETLITEMEQPKSTPSTPPRFTKIVAIRILAAAALLSGIFFAARPYLNSLNQDQTVTIFYGNKVEDSRVAMDMMEETMCDIFDRPDVETELADLFN